MPSLLERCREAPVDLKRQDELLTATLESENVDDLKSIANDQQCGTLFRCAALDRLVECLQEDSRELLEQLVNPEREPNEDVRETAFQALSSLEAGPVGAVQTAGAVRTRGAVIGPPVPTPDWRELAANDPSDRIRWLASLGR